MSMMYVCMSCMYVCMYVCMYDIVVQYSHTLHSSVILCHVETHIRRYAIHEDIHTAVLVHHVTSASRAETTWYWGGSMTM
jgi:hypothetical protein